MTPKHYSMTDYLAGGSVPDYPRNPPIPATMIPPKYCPRCSPDTYNINQGVNRRYKIQCNSCGGVWDWKHLTGYVFVEERPAPADSQGDKAGFKEEAVRNALIQSVEEYVESQSTHMRMGEQYTYSEVVDMAVSYIESKYFDPYILSLQGTAQEQPVDADGWIAKPKVVCFCGSTRFAEWFMIKRWELEKQGIITLGINILPNNYFAEGDSHGAEQEGVKEILDELHKRKIDLADEVFILNVDGYIGESTRNELEYALQIGKPVKCLEPLPNPPQNKGGDK